MNKKMLNILVDVLMVLIAIYTMTATWAGFSWYWLLSTVVLWAGTVGTIMTAKKHAKAGIPNLIQNVFNLYVSGVSRIPGDALMSLWYAGNEFTSLKTWGENSEGNKVETEKTVDWKHVFKLVVITGIGLGLFSYFVNGRMIVLDALNNASGAFAEYMQKVKRQRASWWLWGITNLIGIYMWWDINPIQSGMYVAFLLNTVRGYINWSE